MTLHEIEEYAVRKMTEWGLTDKGWSFGWNRGRKTVGLCTFQRENRSMFSTVTKPPIKTITLSSILMKVISEEDQKDTLLHEMAHALDFEQRGHSGHDETWRWWAIKVGARPERCLQRTSTLNEALASMSKYTLRCPNGHETAYHRRLKVRRSCSKCCPGHFNEEYLLEVIQNY